MNNHKIFLDLTTKFAIMSKCQSLQVCALFVKENRIISTGINIIIIYWCIWIKGY